MGMERTNKKEEEMKRKLYWPDAAAQMGQDRLPEDAASVRRHKAEDRIAALEAENDKYKEALNYLKDSVVWNGDSTERMVYSVCTTALK